MPVSAAIVNNYRWRLSGGEIAEHFRARLMRRCVEIAEGRRFTHQIVSSGKKVKKAPNAPVVKSLDGQQVKLPGYIVPLEVSEEGRTTEFLLVPYYGACIHVPPPPSNQIVHIFSEMGVRVEDLYQPYWIEGKMQVKSLQQRTGRCRLPDGSRKIYAYELK